MKLLYCKHCKDIFNLKPSIKSCECGKSSGYYTDDLNAVYSGECVPLGIANGTFMQAVKHPPMYEPSVNIVAFIIPEICKTFKRL